MGLVLVAGLSLQNGPGALLVPHQTRQREHQHAITCCCTKASIYVNIHFCGSWYLNTSSCDSSASHRAAGAELGVHPKLQISDQCLPFTSALFSRVLCEDPYTYTNTHKWTSALKPFWSSDWCSHLTVIPARNWLLVWSSGWVFLLRLAQTSCSKRKHGHVDMRKISFLDFT